MPCRAVDENDVLRSFHELATMQLAHRCLVHLAGREVEVGQIPVGREACHLHVVGDRAHLALRDLSLQELRQDRHGGFERRRTLLDQVGHGLSHPVHLEAAQHDHDGTAGWVMTHGGLQHREAAARHSAPHWPGALA